MLGNLEKYVMKLTYSVYHRIMDVTKTRNGEWGMGNGEWRMGNG